MKPRNRVHFEETRYQVSGEGFQSHEYHREAYLAPTYIKKLRLKDSP